MQFEKRWCCIVMVMATILLADITILHAQTNETPKPEKTNSNESANEIDSAAESELQRTLNEIRKEYLDTRETLLDRWMWLVTIILATVGLIVPIALAIISYIIGRNKFRELETEAGKLVEEIKEHREQSKVHLKKITSIDINDPEKTSEIEEAVQDVQSDPEPSLIDKVITEIYTLQRNGRKEDAIEKWRSIANIAEGTDKELAARAWLSIAYLLAEGDDQLDAYQKALDLNPNLSRYQRNQPISRHSMLFHDGILVGAVLRYFNDSKFQDFSTEVEQTVGTGRYRADVVLYGKDGDLTVVVECRSHKDIAKETEMYLKELFRHSKAKFGIIVTGPDASIWTFLKIFEDRVTEISRSQFEEAIVES